MTISSSWTPDFTTSVIGRAGKSPSELGVSLTGESCPDILLLTNGDLLIIGVEAAQIPLPNDVSVANNETVVMVPQQTFMSAAHGVCNAALTE